MSRGNNSRTDVQCVIISYRGAIIKMTFPVIVTDIGYKNPSPDLYPETG